MKLRLATRGSRLAVAQSRWVAACIHARRPDIDVELVTITSEGDRVQDKPLWEEGGKGLFTRAIDDAVLSGNADFAVHSLKDMPYRLADGIVLAAVPERADARDVFVFAKRAQATDQIKKIASSSPRRVGAMRLVAPQAEIVMMRGNVDTRLRKLAEGEADAILLAEAGLQRLGLSPIRQPISPDQLVPCAGQGCLAVTARMDGTVTEVVALLNHADSRFAAEVERGVLEGLEASCTWPIGAFASKEDGKWNLRTAVYGKTDARVEPYPLDRTRGAREQGMTVASAMIDKGARNLLA